MNMPVSIKMPAKPINAMPLRLFISGLSARLGFDVETIEDIKTAVSEVCVLLFSNVKNGELEVIIHTDNCIDITAQVTSAEYITDNDDALELSKMLIEALADEAYISYCDDVRVNKVQIIFNLGV